MTRPILITTNSPHLEVSNSRGLESIGFFTTPRTSDHFVDANKMIQIGPGPFSRRWENSHCDYSNSVEFHGIEITSIFATARPTNHSIGVCKIVGTASRKPLEFERFKSAPQPQPRALHPMRRSRAPARRYSPQPQQGAKHQPMATPLGYVRPPHQQTLKGRSLPPHP